MDKGNRGKWKKEILIKVELEVRFKLDSIEIIFTGILGPSSSSMAGQLIQKMRTREIRIEKVRTESFHVQIK